VFTSAESAATLSRRFDRINPHHIWNSVAIKIGLFNHKGGVSKTTTTFNLGWMLAEKGKRVILVDADPQCNLTGIVMGFRGPTELERFFTEEAERNLRAGLSPAFESRPKAIEGIDCVPVPGRDGLFLLPGHIRLAEYEVTLGIAQELSGSLQALQNLPGSISYLLDRTADRHQADFILIDMSPSLSSINQNLLMTSEYFIVPSAPDFYSLMALDSLANVLPKWRRWADQAKAMSTFRDADYPFPQADPRFLGVIIQNYRPRAGQPAQAFQRWIDQIDVVAQTTLLPSLAGASMSLPTEKYAECGLHKGYRLATIPDFNSLIAASQEHQTPVFALTAGQMAAGGVIKQQFEESRDRFHGMFSDLADAILCLTN
jgi:cellulose biosynthesis protein BcsQ